MLRLTCDPPRCPSRSPRAATAPRRVTAWTLLLLVLTTIWAAGALAQSSLGASKSFAPAVINSGGTSVMTIQLVNNLSTLPESNFTFSDTFPAGMSVAPGTATTQCNGGTLTLGAASFTFSGGTLAAGATCNIDVNVTAVSATDTTLTNTTSTFAYQIGGSGSGTAPAASGDLGVVVPPSVTLAFVPSSIASGGTSRLTLVYDSGGSAKSALAVSSGPLASPLTVTAGSGTTTCPNGAFTYGANSFTFSNTLADVLPANTTCTITVDVSGVVASATTVTQGPIDVSATILPCGRLCFRTTASSNSANLAIAAPLVVTTTSPLPSGTVGTPYSVTFAASGGTGAPTWSIVGGAVPPGLVLSSGGVLSGTPTAFGTFNFTVQAQDKLGTTATKPFALTINPAPLVITTPSPLAAGTVGAAYSLSLAATGGVPPYTWSVIAGALPPGLTLSPSGLLSGTPGMNGAFAFTVQVMDSRGVTTSKAFALTINPAPLVITTLSLPNGVQNAPYSASFGAVGGVPPYTWSLASGSLPPGLVLGSNGTLVGIPVTLGTFTFDVRVTDTLGATTTRTFSVTIGPPALTIVTGTPLAPPQNVGTPFALTFAAAGGQPPYAWSLAGGSLPPGLSLNASGLLSGIPTAVGSYTFTVRVLDAGNASATRTYSLDVVVPPLVITTPAPLAPPLGVAGPFSVTLQAQGGLPPYTWSLAGGALPPGLVLNANGVLGGTPTQAGTFTFDARVVDALGTSSTRTYVLIVQALGSALSVAIAPNPAVLGMPVTITAAVGGGAVAATGTVDVFVAGAGLRCPAPFVAGNPGDPVAPARSATLDAAGHADVSTSTLPIGDYFVCVRYGGDALHSGATAGPFGLAVIKGVILAPRSVDAALTLVVEYYHAGLDHYFVTTSPQEMSALDSGRLVGWKRTGYAFWAFDAPPNTGQALPVCRFYLPPRAGDSHFLSASPAECAAVAALVRTDPAYAGVVLETPNAFYIPLPDAAGGRCGASAQSVYRLWNGRADSNHRYTVDPDLRAAMLSLGYVAEGYGPDGVAMCAP